MNNKEKIIVASFLIGFIGFSGCLADTRPSVEVIELSEKPDDYFNITQDEIERFPSLKKALQNINESFKISNDKINSMQDFFKEKETKNIKYQDKYYKIRISSGCI